MLDNSGSVVYNNQACLKRHRVSRGLSAGRLKEKMKKVLTKSSAYDNIYKLSARAGASVYLVN